LFKWNYSSPQQKNYLRPEFQYWAEAFETYQRTAKSETAVVPEVKVQEVKGRSRNNLVAK